VLLSLLNSHSTGKSAHSAPCMNERAHNLKASVSAALVPNRPRNRIKSGLCGAARPLRRWPLWQGSWGPPSAPTTRQRAVEAGRYLDSDHQKTKGMRSPRGRSPG
jgi:hypothetical protein